MSLCRVGHPLQSAERMVSAQTTLCHLRPLFREWGRGVWVLEGLGPLRSFFKPRTNPSMITKIRAKSDVLRPSPPLPFPCSSPRRCGRGGPNAFLCRGVCLHAGSHLQRRGQDAPEHRECPVPYTCPLLPSPALGIFFPSRSVSLRVCPCW